MGTILLADDSLTIQKVVELTFADTKHEVVATSSGDDLLTKLTEVRPDLVICDVIMPGIDGYDVCQRIKSSPGSLHIPVVLLTGTFEPFDRDRALAAGCSEIITKPFEARRLVDTVERLLSQGAAAAPAISAASVESEVDTFEGQVVPPQPPRLDDFGTRLSPPPGVASADDDGMDFTASGFSEMEAAGVEDQVVEPPSEGLDFEIGELPIEPDAGGDRSFAAGFDGTSDTLEAPEPNYDTDEQPPTVAEEPVEVVEARPDFDSGQDDGELEEWMEAPLQDDLMVADTTPVVAPEFAPPPLVPPPVGPPTVPAAATPTGGLSDDDVDRIARRVLELAGDRLEQIAWEVIPDMAEIVVRERVRELEADVDPMASDRVQ